MKKNLLSLLKHIFIVFFLVLTIGCSDNSNANNAFNYLTGSSNILLVQKNHDDYIPDTTLPTKYDLRDFGIVTPVKNQKPWNSCWGFAAIAAAETSILSSLGQTYDQTGLDLSERHLIYFSKSHVIDQNDSQYGEGLYYDNKDSFDSGGFTYTATSIFSSGTGVLSESLVPYRGKEEKIDNNKKNYSKNDDWSVDEKYRYVQEYKLFESNVLPCPACRDEKGQYIGYNAYATDCIKKELLSGRAVSICYHSEKGNEVDGPRYLNVNNNNWTHYTYDDAPYSHSVTIIGYDDSISKELFINHSFENDNNNPFYPEGDGAWIAKNSWGAENQDFPNNEIWGIKDENGKATGYFYLSYYDHSLYCPESFIFEPSSSEDEYIINQYDFLQSKSTKSIYGINEVKMANVFNNSIDKIIQAISIETCNEDVDANVKIFLLDDDYRNPEDGQLLYDKNYNFDYAGYHKIDLDTELSVNKKQLVSIIVTQTINVNDTIYYEIFVDMQQKKDENGIVRANGVVNKGESYIYIRENDMWYDWSEIIDIFKSDVELGEYVYDNFPIKMYSIFNKTLE